MLGSIMCLLYHPTSSHSFFMSERRWHKKLVMEEEHTLEYGLEWSSVVEHMLSM